MEKNIEDIEKVTPDVRGLVTTAILDKKLKKLRKKFLIMLSILLLQNLINFMAQYLIKNQNNGI